MNPVSIQASGAAQAAAAGSAPARRRRALALAVAAGLLLAGPAEAQLGFAQGTTQTESSFTFRRVTPPPPGARKRIILQSHGSSAPKPAAAEGFWARPGAAPGLTPRRPLAPALAAAAAHATATGAGARAAADRAVARRIMAAHGSAMLAAARSSDLSLTLLLAVAIAESGGDSRAVSPKGAQGMMQLMPATAAGLGVRDPFSPEQAAPGAARHLDGLLRRFDEDPVAALAAYNAGAGAVQTSGGVPPYPETRGYVPRVLAAAAALQELCETPPASFRDQCLPSVELTPSAALAARGPRGG